MWREILDYLARNKDSLSILVSIVVGIATLITSIVSIHVMMSQNRISQEQTDIQKSQIQPIFTIVVHQQQDFDDGKFGTEVLNVRNLGSKVLDYSIDVDVFFQLSRHEKMQNDTIYFEIPDYFNASYSDNTGNDLIKTYFGVGNNRIFCKLYQHALDASHNDVMYFLEKVILCKITYHDILKNKHTLLFENGDEISQDRYNKYFTSAQLTSTFGIALRKLNFANMKMKVESISKK